VAYITPDPYAVHLRIFSRDPNTGKWDLGKPTPINIPRGHDEFPFVHVSWSNLGNDLAIINATGYVMIFSCAMVLDRMTFMRTDLPQHEIETDAVVGMHWLAILPYEQKVRFLTVLHTIKLTDLEPDCLVGSQGRREMGFRGYVPRLPRYAPSSRRKGFIDLS
jgi:hypothetical protein